MLWVVKILVFMAFSFALSAASAREIRILVVGEGAAANCNSHRFPVIPGVYEITKSGAQRLAQDPLELAECSGGSVWMPLGAEIINTGFAEKVVFASIAVSRARVRDWQPGAGAYERLKMFSRNSGVAPIKFDYAIWYQGFSDLGISQAEYFDNVLGVLRAISLSVNIDKWLIAQGVRCGGEAESARIESAHLQIAKNPVLNRFPGPHVNRLDKGLYGSGCELNEAGQKELGKQWLEAMKRADNESEKYAKESLLYYFK
jgi:hypothetical protein